MMLFAGIAAIWGCGILAAQTPMPMPYTVPFEKQYRVILCMDTANEVDDALAIVHALLTPQFDVKVMIAEQFRVKKEDRVKRPPLELSVAETERVFEKAGFLGKMPIIRGAAEPMIDDKTPQESEGARFIIAEALKDDKRPLFVCCGGPLTDIASAILLEPSIGRATRIRSIPSFRRSLLSGSSRAMSTAMCASRRRDSP